MQTRSNYKQLTESVVLDALRNATHGVHKRLHQHPLTGPLVQPNLDQDHYILVLQAFERFHASVERQCATLPAIYPVKKKSLILQCDLMALGSLKNSLPPCTDLYLKHSTDSFLGMMYVIEGSSLGGQIIAKNIHKTLGYTRSNGASFFHGRGKNTMRDWKAFLSILDEQVLNIDECTEAALKTFKALEVWLWSAFKNHENN